MLLLEVTVGQRLLARQLTLGVAESCTGGLVGHRLTDVAGSSRYFLGSLVTYAYSAKEQVLGIPHDVLLAHGAVSEVVARAMARGARQVLGADLGLSVTGIAGPDGGMPGKPVGLVWIGFATATSDWAKQFIWSGDRQSNKAQSAEAALQLLADYLAASP